MATMTPGDETFADAAPFRIITEVNLRQPPNQVWDVLVDNERWPEWFSSCKAARNTSDPAHGVGSTRWVQVDQFKVNERIIAWDEPHRWGFTILDANMPIATTIVELIDLAPDGDGTALTYTFSGELKPWLRPLTPVFRWRFTNLFAKGLAGLQPHLDRLHA